MWDITDHQNIFSITPNVIQNSAKFIVSTDSLHEFVAFSFESSEFLSPEIIGEIPNQDLHGLSNIEMLIVTTGILQEEANQLAEFHNSRGLSTEVVLLEEIYNEFSSGSPDVSAIRNFVRFLYSPNNQIPLRYLLLFGDGSFDNRSTFNDANPSNILTYQSENSFLATESFVTDDYFGLLDENEGESFGLLDIGVGRLPVSNHDEAIIVLDKIYRYYDENSFASWRNELLLIADDGDYNIHFDQAQFLASYIDTAYNEYNINKVYFDAFPSEDSSSGVGFPAATSLINDKISKGCLIVNYTGHGDELGLGGEKVVSIDDILSWDNTNSLNLFMTATCEFSRFDDYDRTTAGELVLLNPTGGSIALFTTTRLVYSTPNFILNQNFYKYVFNKPTESNRLGDIMMNTKVNSGQGLNKRNFTLLGDPALELAIPQFEVVVTTINDISSNLFSDTIFGLSFITIEGEVIVDDSIIVDGFNGKLYVKVYDQIQQLSTLGNGDNETSDFNLFENVVFKGIVNITEGKWHVSFIIPRDISVNIGNGRISLYAINKIDNYFFDANGVYDDFLISGSKISNLDDNEGPEIELYFGDDSYLQGDFVSNNPLILIYLKDSSGINTTGFSIGRNITAQIDNDPAKNFMLNDEYEADIDSYQSGRISFMPGELERGNHVITVKAWDVANNQTELIINFEVLKVIDIEINRIFNYPNPFTNDTKFYFEHNSPGSDFEVQIIIYSITGKIVKSISSEIICEKSLSDGIYWNGLSDFGDKLGRGVYMYTIKIKTSDGLSATALDKLVILK